MIIRDFLLSDLDDVVRIEYEAFDDPYPVGILLQLYNAGAGFLVAQVAQTIVGYVIFWIKEGQGHIIVIAVDSNYQDMKVGSLLLEKTCFIFKRNNINTVFLEVRKSNIRAINFYKRNGFVKINEEDDYYNDGESAIIMQYSNYDDCI
ncbi:ribosomal protein S18-alanine N-acetyltransferase [Methanosphaera stadtmanae]|jgi:ribosomal-protein-alanine N-acetyltransferase|uniref:Predicted acetyltransferase n=2 Tax=Methanosphaera stadtmanae TaxID=2317 RepID=Q2NF20_METST|nr:ribosomal protein S18-alanine N-acetyltransferase [Methanosphaera stadtmanae]ABC57583.1 predicted acetyltransferase [Methanosphaera stadtmanae DSM 3091]MEE0489540.1 ribosomal protein S18-alanine N-acetyltransferase [Methanosphaera stadtmanae]RAP02780.1 ribosomal-protein-alanine N-acetyltransferase RimI [Methanosphaera stadtmanae]